MDVIVLALDKMSAKIALLFLALVMLKFVTKRLRWTAADRFLTRIHKPATVGLFISGLIHTVASVRLFSLLGPAPYVLGGISLLAMAGAAWTFRLRKTSRCWLTWHRALALAALVTCCLHPAL